MKLDWLLNPLECPGYIKSALKDHIERNDYIHHTEHLTIKIPKRYALVNITSLIEDCLERAGVIDGFCFVSAMHITAGVYVNDAEFDGQREKRILVKITGLKKLK